MRSSPLMLQPDFPAWRGLRGYKGCEPTHAQGVYGFVLNVVLVTMGVNPRPPGVHGMARRGVATTPLGPADNALGLQQEGICI
jgi:hypothetical protein